MRIILVNLSDIWDIIPRQPEKIFSELPDEVDDVFISFGADVIRPRVIGEEDKTSSPGRIVLPNDNGLELRDRSGRPGTDFHIPTEPDRMAEATPKVKDIQPCLGFEGVLGIHADLDKIFENPVEVSTAVINDPAENEFFIV